MHDQPALKAVYPNQEAHPFSERAAARVMSLPFHPYLSESDQSRVIDGITKVLRAAAA
jgi:UDP-2-acetamido-2-deoxy-ribo-hexuluronate aminotransferase